MLAHPILIFIPAGLFVATDWGFGTKNNPAAHGFSEIVYEFTSASANNGSGFEGLGDTVGFAADDAPTKAPQRNWDIACGLVMLFGRFIPIIAPIAIAGSLAVKKATPLTVGTLRTDTLTFGFVLLGTILLVGRFAVPAGGGAGSGGRTSRSATVWRLRPPQLCDSFYRHKNHDFWSELNMPQLLAPRHRDSDSQQSAGRLAMDIRRRRPSWHVDKAGGRACLRPT